MLVDMGADPYAVDKAIVGFGMPMGPFRYVVFGVCLTCGCCQVGVNTLAQILMLWYHTSSTCLTHTPYHAQMITLTTTQPE